MKVGESWLREWIDGFPIDGKKISHHLTMIGLEALDNEYTLKSFSKILVGKITDCTKLFNKRNLYLNRVFLGEKILLSIISTSIKCRVGLKVAVATHHSVLHGKNIDKITQILGHYSEGILCTYAMLGLSKHETEIIEIPDDIPVGENICKYLTPDNIIDLNVTPNRSDCLSIIGIARDIAAVSKKSILDNKDKRKSTIRIQDTIPIRIEKYEYCPRYLGCIIKDIDSSLITPLWIQQRLCYSDIKLSNNIVLDIANYVLLELGQPIQILDLDCIDKDIVVRMAREKEQLVLANNQKILLREDTLVVADRSKILSVAGILDSNKYAVNKKTNHIFIGCAFFYPSIITHSSRSYDLCTESSHRYERGVDPLVANRAMEKITHLLTEVCGGKLGPVKDVSNTRFLPDRVIIALYRKKLNLLSGTFIETKEIFRILESIGCSIIEKNGVWYVTTPSWRFDLRIEEDLIEEIIRIYGYDRISNSAIKNKNYPLYEKINIIKKSLSLKNIQKILINRGFQEVITYSFINPKMQRLIFPDKSAIKLPNPISQEMSEMRLSLWPGLLNTLLYNQNRQSTRIRIFESGICFKPDSSKSGIHQELVLSGLGYGSQYQEHWSLNKKNIDFYDLKGDIESIFESIGYSEESIHFESINDYPLHPGKSATIILNKINIGYIGALHPTIENQLAIKKPTVLFEIFWDKVSKSKKSLHNVNTFSYYPSNRRDISIAILENIKVSDVIATCKSVSSVKCIVNVHLFDIYRSVSLPPGYKGISIGLNIQGIDHTLEETELADIVKIYTDTLKSRYQILLR